jgi:integrase
MDEKKVRHSLRTFIQGYKVRENNAITGKVCVRVVWKAGEVMFFTGYYAESHKWDAAQQRCIRNTTHANKDTKTDASTINAKITDYESAVEDAFNLFCVNGITAEEITPKTLKDEVYKRLKLSEKEIIARKRAAREEVPLIPEDKKTLFDYLDEFIEDGTNDGWRTDTIKKFGTLKNKLQRFDKNLSFNRLDKEHVKSFVRYLVNTCKYRNVSVQSMIKNFRWFMRWCEERNLVTDKDVIEYRSKLKDVEHKTIVFLTWDEFQQVYNYEVPRNKQYLQRVKDVFIFQCVTGLRYTDLANLKRSNINLKENKFVVVTSKTADQTTIDFNSYSREVYNKYSDFKYESDHALPVPSNQKYNDYLKELCQLAGINSMITISFKTGGKIVTNEVEKWKKISTHSGRRTFVSIGLALGATPEEIAKVTGHHSLQIMQHYIGTDDSQRRHATSVWDEKTERDKFIQRLQSMSISDIKEMFALWDAK